MALRPRLSTGLPLATKVKCQSVADFSQVLKSCLDSQIVHSAHLRLLAICCVRVSIRQQGRYGTGKGRDPAQDPRALSLVRRERELNSSQPTSRTSLASLSAIVRACRSSVTT